MLSKSRSSSTTTPGKAGESLAVDFGDHTYRGFLLQRLIISPVSLWPYIVSCDHLESPLGDTKAGTTIFEAWSMISRSPTASRPDVPKKRHWCLPWTRLGTEIPMRSQGETCARTCPPMPPTEHAWRQTLDRTSGTGRPTFLLMLVAPIAAYSALGPTPDCRCGISNTSVLEVKAKPFGHSDDPVTDFIHEHEQQLADLQQTSALCYYSTTQGISSATDCVDHARRSGGNAFRIVLGQTSRRIRLAKPTLIAAYVIFLASRTSRNAAYREPPRLRCVNFRSSRAEAVPSPIIRRDAFLSVESARNVFPSACRLRRAGRRDPTPQNVYSHAVATLNMTLRRSAQDYGCLAGGQSPRAVPGDLLMLDADGLLDKPVL
ncbi:hypothetical protein NUW54_g3065 [Trametes sanguinea]|uniref:Uncharacterized protein n=1 Tax=Trametes sanguinea TaxID=158606 RepID=A0ACC1Q312_9APHY|nr:hypothetical protein NUW54_g3065 [Trametes sanguinea]